MERLVGHKVTSSQSNCTELFCNEEVLHHHWDTGLGGRGPFFLLCVGFYVCLLLIAESGAFRIVFFIQLHF